jgi:hypothetical protein
MIVFNFLAILGVELRVSDLLGRWIIKIYFSKNKSGY